MSITSTASSASARALLSMLRKLPTRVQAIVKSELQPVGELDYRPRKLHMAVSSPWQAYRLRSCRKEPETVQWLESQLRPGDCFYDIGANVGAYSLVAFAITGGRASVFAFEPGFTTFPELVRNVHLNRAAACITPLSIALGDETGIATLHYSDLTAGAARHDWHTSESGTLALPTVCYRLDDLIAALKLPPPTLLKLDVDGPERAVLRGADHTLAAPSLRSCLVELDVSSESYEDIVALLDGKGLRVASRHVRGGGGSTYNVIFTRD